MDRQIHAVVKLLSSARTNSYILRFCTEEWGGVQKRQAETYIQRARVIIKADYSVERSDFLGTRLALLDEIIEASIHSKQNSNAIGALKLQAQLTRLLEGSLMAIKNPAIDDGVNVLPGDGWRQQRSLLFPCGSCIAFSRSQSAPGFPTSLSQASIPIVMDCSCAALKSPPVYRPSRNPLAKIPIPE